MPEWCISLNYCCGELFCIRRICCDDGQLSARIRTANKLVYKLCRLLSSHGERWRAVLASRTTRDAFMKISQRITLVCFQLTTL
jgi:hypothetical protein